VVTPAPKKGATGAGKFAKVCNIATDFQPMLDHYQRHLGGLERRLQEEAGRRFGHDFAFNYQ
jgi:hypothetical protein